jgi:hypothetical protein
MSRIAVLRTAALAFLLFSTQSGQYLAASPGLVAGGSRTASIEEVASRLPAGFMSASSPVPDGISRLRRGYPDAETAGARGGRLQQKPPGPVRSRIVSGTAAEPTEVVEETWDAGLSQWVNWRRTVYAYNLLLAPVEIIAYYWVAAAWVENYRNRYMYDEDGYLIEEYEDEWDGNAWAAIALITYLNNPAGLALSAVYQQWIGAQWTNLFRYTFTYDGSGNLLQELWEQWVVSVWTNYVLFTYTYNLAGRLTSAEYAMWQASAWIAVYRSLLTYDPSGWLVLILSQIWNGAEWGDDNRSTFTNDAEGRPIEEILEFWGGGVWTRDLRRVTTYDGAGNVTEERDETWNGASWDYFSRVLNTYNLSASPAAGGPAGGRRLSASDLLQSVSQLWIDTAWVNSYRVTNTYGPGTAVESPEELPGEFRLETNYPNPFNPLTTVVYAIPERSFVTLQVFDALGRGVATLAEGERPAGVHEVRWNAAQIPTGVYYCRLQAAGFVGIRKLVLMR